MRFLFLLIPLLTLSSVENPQSLFNKIDTNNDKSIDKDEWSSARQLFRERIQTHKQNNPISQEQIRERRQRIIEEFDLDKNGILDAKEKEEAKKIIRQRLEQRFQEKFEKMDQNKDGKLIRPEMKR